MTTRIPRLRICSFCLPVLLLASASLAASPADIANGIFQRYAATLEAGDLEGWLSLWEDDAIQMPPGEPMRVGLASIRARNAPVIQRYAFEMDITLGGACQAAPDVIIAWGNYTASLTARQPPDPPLHIDGKFLSVLHRSGDGSWKLQRDMFNSNRPAE